MSLFDENLAVITKKNVMTFIADMDANDVPFSFVGKDEDGTKVFCDNNNQPFIIEPTIDEEHLPNPNLRQLIFFFGIASLEEIRKVSKSAHTDSIFVLIEPNPYFLQHAMYYEHFKILNDIRYVIVSEKPNKLDGLFKLLFSTSFFYLTKNMLFYLNDYYRKYDGGFIKKYIKEIGTALQNKFFAIGNSIYDSLLGLINNMNNLKAISENVDVAEMKNIFAGKPAFVVSAGPSLDKNMAHLKKAQGKALIIAVDTIAAKLIKNGIVPDFVATVERGIVVWEYFYEKQEYPDNTFLISSLVADPLIVKKFRNRAILPLRHNVREYVWFNEQLGLTDDHYMTMGASCAHLAMGLAMHIGASPIVLVGQDLAYGEKGTHATGTIYDVKELPKAKDIMVDGYYGGQVRTQKVWLEFKLIFESMIKQNPDMTIINATEGGARIEGTQPECLSDVVQKYCKDTFNVCECLGNLPHTKIDWQSVEQKIHHYLIDLEGYRTKVAKHLKKLKEFNEKWNPSMPESKVNKIYQVMKKTDQFYLAIGSNQLLFHNVQGPLMVLLQKFHTIEETDSLESLKQNLLVQIELCEMLENTAWLIIQVIEENFPWSEDKPEF